MNPPTEPSNRSSWSSYLQSLTSQGLFVDALQLCRRIHRLDLPLDRFVLPPALKACSSSPSNLPFSLQLHAYAHKTSYLSFTFVITSLLSAYVKLAAFKSAYKLFDEIPQPTVVAWSAFIGGLARNAPFAHSLSLFKLMRVCGPDFNSATMLGLLPACTQQAHLCSLMALHTCNVKVGMQVSEPSVSNCLVTAYAKCGNTALARQVFDETLERDLVGWNAMLSAYCQNGEAHRALELYQEMVAIGVEPDSVTLVCVLSACTHLGAIATGLEAHERTKRFMPNLPLSNAIVNMYARCGDLSMARAHFDEMSIRTVVTWTTLISGYGAHGHGAEGAYLFDAMVVGNIRPDATAFVAVLSACSHAGLVDKALAYFASMKQNYMIEPRLEHYACMVDVLGRAGRLDEAMALIEAMRVEPDGAVWGALLGACRIHLNVRLAEKAANQVFQIEPNNVGYYVLLSNIYASAKDHRGVAKIRALMRERGLKKPPGLSYIELERRVHVFMADDHSHPRSEAIYKELERLEKALEEVGYVRDTSVADALFGVEEERRGEVLGVHSERLAVVFGLMCTGMGERIVVIKNLRVCGDCHEMIKFTTMVASREIVVRDATRFHHFKQGACSCRGYW
ncbi:hypothetical protein AMTRI_Chr04g246070 [Amborella trichopoda]